MSKTKQQTLTSKTIKSESSSVDSLREQWRTMYTETLPKAARERMPTQKDWPVTLDHCFARIILDAVTGDTPWMEKIKSPAYKNMNGEQLRKALEIGHQILDGKASLVELDERSLALRGKKSKVNNKVPSKRKTPNESVNETKTSSSPSTKKVKIDLTKEEDTIDLTEEHEDDESDNLGDEKEQDRRELEAMIDGSEKSEFQKKCLKLLVQIPEGHFSTYGAMAKALGSAPRAVGNAMRNNPFAPRVPCHRILAADRTIGGFGGSWGVDGKHYNEKMELLHKEGVKFDSKGRVIGPVFEGFAPV